MQAPYYTDPSITLYCGDSFALMEALLIEGKVQPFDVVITDPPYSARTHKGARTLKKKAETAPGPSELIDFQATDLEKLRKSFTLMAKLTRTWVIATVDYKHAVGLELMPPEGLDFVRMGIWVKPNSAPQFSGDRPGMGWEAIVFMHRKDMPMVWNGHGRNSVFIHNIERNQQHPTQKPLGLMGEMVRLFTNEGDLILDPYCGSGTTLRSAKDLGRRAVGMEKEEKYCKIAMQRARQEVLPFVG